MEIMASRPEVPEIGGSNHEDTDGILTYCPFFKKKKKEKDKKDNNSAYHTLSDLVVSQNTQQTSNFNPASR